MKKEPKILKKLPQYILIFVLAATLFTLATGQFNIRVTNVSSQEEEVSNYVETIPENSLVKLQDLLAGKDKIMLYIKSTWCGVCNLVKPEIKSYISDKPQITVYEIDLDTYRAILSEADVSITPSFVFVTAENITVVEDITLDRIETVIAREFF